MLCILPFKTIRLKNANSILKRFWSGAKRIRTRDSVLSQSLWCLIHRLKVVILSKSMQLRCNDAEALLAVMVSEFRPWATSDGWSAKMEEQRVLLTELQCSERADISKAARQMLVQFDRSIQQEKESERREFSDREERFE